MCIIVCVRSYAHIITRSDTFVQERGVARLWEAARFNFLLPLN